MRVDPTIIVVGAMERDIEEALRASGLEAAFVPDVPSADAVPADVPQVVVLDVRGTRAVPPGVAELTQARPSLGVVIVASSLEPALMLEALHAGAKGFVAAPLNADELKAAIERVLAPVHRQAGRILAFVGAKGGVGTTTLAVNTATALAKHAKGDTLLIDLNARYGDAAAWLGAEPRFTVIDALENAHRLDLPFMRGLVTRTAEGLELLAAADRAALGPPDLMRLRALLEFVKRDYRYTVLDLPRTDAAVLEALDEVSAIVVVVSQELTAVRSGARLLETLRQRYGGERVQIALGRQDRDSDISPDDLAKTLRGPVRVFPNEYRRALESLNRGKPLVLENHSRLSAELSRFVREFAGVRPAKGSAAAKKSILPKWLGGQS